MTFSKAKRWTPERVAEVHYLRRTGHKPAEIAEMVGRTVDAIHRLLSIEKKRGIVHEPLRHGNLKWDKAIVDEWRELARSLNQGEIAERYGVHRELIAQKFAADVHGELRW